ncbi:S4 domain-containing protein YaaA [Clostridium fermenticellae]|uniref:S4 domain-containing protein YaaA n=1 Tax=Clostridium fermenticellae TaxID=2068654 RepID=A0A386H074_9CLOT|nr:S4 domain-containing protein YaaA [Clostridium fermenticellae]AYD39049.1 S4 domain-containing protein YaaA [Clostridium fermenticellae]
MNEIKINTDFIKLDSFLKWCGAVSAGSDAKIYILSGNVRVNEEVETRRGRKLFKGDVITFDSNEYKIV